jgi:hypothetical protein
LLLWCILTDLTSSLYKFVLDSSKLSSSLDIPDRKADLEFLGSIWWENFNFRWLLNRTSKTPVKQSINEIIKNIGQTIYNSQLIKLVKTIINLIKLSEKVLPDRLSMIFLFLSNFLSFLSRILKLMKQFIDLFYLM